MKHILEIGLMSNIHGNLKTLTDANFGTFNTKPIELNVYEVHTQDNFNVYKENFI